jgi:DNA-binding response OmpR family regulator
VSFDSNPAETIGAMSGASDNHEAQRQREDEERGTRSVPPPSVLIMDERVIADTLAYILKLSGFRAFPAHTADQAIKIAEQNPLDFAILELIFVDCGTPIIEFPERIRKLQPRCRIIIWGGRILGEYIKSLPPEVSGQFDFLAKPVHPEDLLRRLRKPREPGE